MTELCRLAAKYGTDKTHYTPFYSLLLDGIRQNTHQVLEIGIGTPQAMRHIDGYKPGASLRMWEEYFPYAYIYGMDKDSSVLFSTQRIQTFKADQYQPETYSDMLQRIGPFDLIVDDGSHNAEHQLLTSQTLLPLLRTGGLYIIEDVNVADGLLDKLPVPFSYVQVRGSLTGHCVVING